MRNNWCLTALFATFLLTTLNGCKKMEVRGDNPPIIIEDSSQSSEAPSSPAALDEKTVEKVNAVLVHVLKNDDKKAKTAYGRNHRFIPPFWQFAFDLRFQNYEHALELLPQLGKSKDEIDFWTRVLNSKPKRLGVGICDGLKNQSVFPAKLIEPSPESKAWAFEIESLAWSLIPKEKAKESQTPSELDKALSVVSCNNGPDKNICLPLTEAQQSTLLTDSFFDKLHNMQRRDTHALTRLNSTVIELMSYPKYVSRMKLLLFYRALKATKTDRQEHFLRRFKGIARDIRVENVSARLVANEIFGDQVDQAFADRLLWLIKSDLQISLVTRLDYILATCNLTKWPPPGQGL